MWTHYADEHKGFCIEYNAHILDGFKQYNSKISLSGKTFEKKGLNPQMDSAQIIIFVFVTKQIDKMCKSSIFFEQ